VTQSGESTIRIGKATGSNENKRTPEIVKASAMKKSSGMARKPARVLLRNVLFANRKDGVGILWGRYKGRRARIKFGGNEAV